MIMVMIIIIDGSTLIPWFRGKHMVWDVTVTYAESHIGDTVTEAGAASNKVAKYNELACMHIF